MHKKLRAFLLKYHAKAGTEKERSKTLQQKKLELIVDIFWRMNAVVLAYANKGNASKSYKERVLEKLAGEHESTVGDDDFVIERFRHFLSPNYNPTKDHPITLRRDIETLYEYYIDILPSMKEIPPLLAAEIDWVMARAACAAAEFIWAVDELGERKDMEERRRKGKLAKKTPLAEEVLMLFSSSVVDLKSMRTMHRVATAIYNHLKKKHDALGGVLRRRTRLPSRVTISRYLLENGRVKAELEKHKVRIPTSLL